MSEIKKIKFGNTTYDIVDKKHIYTEITTTELNANPLSNATITKLNKLVTDTSGADKIIVMLLSTSNSYVPAVITDTASGHFKMVFYINKLNISVIQNSSEWSVTTEDLLTNADIEGKANKSEMSITTTDTGKANIQLKSGTSATVITSVKTINNQSITGTGNLDVVTDISGKADKVANATAGNFAGLDATGNLTDSGSKAEDFATAVHVHGNINNDGTISSVARTIGNGDRLVITDSSADDAIKRTNIQFDGTSENYALTKKGTWKQFVPADDTVFTTDIPGLKTDVSGLKTDVADLKKINAINYVGEAANGVVWTLEDETGSSESITDGLVVSDSVGGSNNGVHITVGSKKYYLIGSAYHTYTINHGDLFTVKKNNGVEMEFVVTIEDIEGPTTTRQMTFHEFGSTGTLKELAFMNKSDLANALGKTTVKSVGTVTTTNYATATITGTNGTLQVYNASVNGDTLEFSAVAVAKVANSSTTVITNTTGSTGVSLVTGVASSDVTVATGTIA